MGVKRLSLQHNLEDELHGDAIPVERRRGRGKGGEAGGVDLTPLSLSGRSINVLGVLCRALALSALHERRAEATLISHVTNYKRVRAGSGLGSDGTFVRHRLAFYQYKTEARDTPKH